MTCEQSILTTKQEATLKSVRRCSRSAASMMENNIPGFEILSHAVPVFRAVAGNIPTLVRENREIADLADSFLKAGECSDDQWDALRRRVEHTGARVIAIFAELEPTANGYGS
jgi:hypothetical protein